MKDKFIIPTALQFGTQSGPGRFSMFASFKMKNGLVEVPLFAREDRKLSDIVGVAKYKRRLDNQGIEAFIELFQSATAYENVKRTWNAGLQLYCVTHMRVAYTLPSSWDDRPAVYHGAIERFEIEAMSLSSYNSPPPGYTPPFFTWP